MGKKKKRKEKKKEEEKKKKRKKARDTSSNRSFAANDRLFFRIFISAKRFLDEALALVSYLSRSRARLLARDFFSLFSLSLCLFSFGSNQLQRRDFGKVSDVEQATGDRIAGSSVGPAKLSALTVSLKLKLKARVDFRFSLSFSSILCLVSSGGLFDRDDIFLLGKKAVP